MDAHTTPSTPKYVSRGGEKLAGALDDFRIDVTGLICADFGSHVGGFVDCLLQRGAAKVYSVDTSYGTLAWKLRKDPRVVVMERTNAMHVALPEQVDLITVDVGWTKQAKVLPNLRKWIRPSGNVIALIKPHYEAGTDCLVDGVLPDDASLQVLQNVLSRATEFEFEAASITPSPLRGHGGNCEYFALLKPASKGVQGPPSPPS